VRGGRGEGGEGLWARPFKGSDECGVGVGVGVGGSGRRESG
jgi:hypothetical protein